MVISRRYTSALFDEKTLVFVPILLCTCGDLLTNMDSDSFRRLMDKLREENLEQYVELPQIAVMGDTSSGKSSLLSAIAGFEIFPTTVT